MDNINEYLENIHQLIAIDSSQNGISEKEAFINYVSDRLITAGEIQDEINYLHFEGEGKNRRVIQLDGYCTDTLSASLVFFIADYSQSNSPITTTDIMRLYKKVEGYLENIDFILEEGEESSGGYQLASSIRNEYAEFSKFKVYLLTDRPLAPSVDSISESKVGAHTIEHYLWDLNRLFQIDNSENGREPITINLTKFTANGKGLPCILANQTKDYTAYLCTIPGRTLADLYNKYTGRLLEGNVRSFLQLKGKVNSGIRKTILTEPENFFTYNNGIAGTAAKVETITENGIGYITSITDFQIVNGGQTTASLAACLINDKKEDSETKIGEIVVQMKLSVVSNLEKAQELIPNISKYTNSQNAVKDTDMWSNHPLHMRLEKISRTIAAPAMAGRASSTFWYYERARGQYAQETYKFSKRDRERFLAVHPKDQLITKTQLGILVNMMNMHPDYASLGGEKSFKKFMDFGLKKWDTSNSFFNEEFFRNVVAMQLMYKAAYKYAASKKYDYKANVVEYAVSRLLYEISNNDQYKGYTIDLGMIWKNQAVSKALGNQLAILVDIAYEHLNAPNRPIINVTEWAKREKCWEMFKNVSFVISKDLLDELDTIANAKSSQASARKELKNAQVDNAMIEVHNYGTSGFRKLLEWNNTSRVLSSDECHLIQTTFLMDKGRFPSDKQCVKILSILERARTRGYLG